MRRVRLGCVVAMAAFQGCSSSSKIEETKPPELVPVKTEFDDVAAALTCDPNDESQNCLEAGDNTIRIDDEVRLQFKSAEFDPETKIVKLELAPGATLDSRFREGVILVRGRKDRRPLLHRVDSLRVTGGIVEMKLSPAKPKDAFKRGRLRLRVPLGANGPTEGTRLRSRPLMRDGQLGTSAQALSIPPIGPQDCSGVVLDSSVSAAGITGTAKLDFTTCRFVLTAWVDATLIWDSLINVDKLEVTVGGSVDAALHAKLDASVTGAIGKSKTIWSFPDIPIVVGGLVLTLTPKIDAGWDLSGKANLSVEQGFDYTGSIEEGFGYSDKKGWYSVDERESTFTKFGPTVTFDGTVTATAWIRPRVDLQAFGIVGGYVALKTFAEGVITSTGTASGNTFAGQICTDLSVGISPTVGASADVFGITLFDENVVLSTIKKKLVDNACTPYTGPIPTDCALDRSACCNDGQCTPATTPGVTVQCEKGASLGGGKFKYACKQHYPEKYCVPGGGAAGVVLCDDKNSLSVDTCVDYVCLNTLPPAFANGADEKQASEGVLVSVCKAPGCCYTNSGCADGIETTVDTCVKAQGAGPDVKGTCTSKPRLIAKF